jgi:hypothetical protein
MTSYHRKQPIDAAYGKTIKYLPVSPEHKIDISFKGQRTGLDGGDL